MTKHDTGSSEIPKGNFRFFNFQIKHGESEFIIRFLNLLFGFVLSDYNAQSTLADLFGYFYSNFAAFNLWNPPQISLVHIRAFKLTENI